MPTVINPRAPPPGCNWGCILTLIVNFVIIGGLIYFAILFLR